MWKALVILGFVLVTCCATASLPGGFEPVDVEDEGVVTAANEATRQLSEDFANKYHHRLTKVLKAKQQIVAGTIYRMDIVIGMTTCRKDEVEFDEAKDCEFQDSVSTYKKCTVLVYRDLNSNHNLFSSACILASKKEL